MKTFRQIIKGSQLGNRFEDLVVTAEAYWLRELGKNDFQHSKAIEQILDRLVPDDLKEDDNKFDKGEIFLLLAAVYLHDIGRKTNEKDHELESYRQIQKNPQKYLLRDTFEAEAVAQICAAHAKENVWPIQRCDANYGIAGLTSSGRPLNLQRMGSLLRIADELDNTYLRVSGLNSQIDSPRNLIRDINPVPSKGIIEIQAQPRTWSDWVALHSIKDYCEQRVREVIPYLEQLGLNYYQVWIQPQNFTAPLTVPKPLESYHDLIEKVSLLLSNRYDSVEILPMVGSCEVSILCSFSPLKIATKIAVLVAPDLTEGITLEYTGAIRNLLEQRLIHHGLIVCGNESIPEKSKRILDDNKIPALTVSGLFSELYDFSSALNRYMGEYENDPIYQKNIFIKPSGSLESENKVININNVEKYLLDWVNKPASIHLTILGDYGSGKTTLVKRFAYQLAKSFLAQQRNSRIPLLISLKSFGHTESIEATITNILVNEMGLDISYKTFDTLNKAGRFVIILDGFDEIPGTSNETSVLNAFRRFDQLSNSQSKIILTCRTHFFKDINQINKIHEGSTLYDSIDSKYGYSLLFLASFDEEQVKQYLIKWDPKNGLDYYNTIQEIYNLKDLAKRPVLLNMIAKTVPILQPRISSENNYDLTAASLYETYIRFWLDRDDWRSRMSILDRRTLAENFANYLFIENKTAIHFSELGSLLPDLSTNTDKKIDPDLLDIECRTCNFLICDRLGNYGFAHRSFQEYFLASLYCQQLLDESNDIDIPWLIPIEDNYLSKGKKKVVSIEVQQFIIQIIKKTLLVSTKNQLNKLLFSSNRPRAEAIFTMLIMEFGFKDYGLIFAYMMHNPRELLPLSILSKMVMNSTQVEVSIEKIVSFINEKSDLDYFLDVYDNLLEQSNKESKPLLEKMRRALERYENKQDRQRISLNENNANYPYSNSKRRSTLAKLLKGIDDEVQQQEINTQFKRHWRRKKMEYDQKRKRGLAIEEREFDFFGDLEYFRKKK
jgi:hypothetical protein